MSSMSYQPPRNVPSFDTNRAEEDKYWKQKQTNGGPSSYGPGSGGHSKIVSQSSGQLKDKLGGLLGGSGGKDLPLYKDKPRWSTKQKGILHTLSIHGRKKRWIFLAVALFGVWWFASSAIAWLSVKEISWTTRSVIVREAFVTSWNDYAKYAWGKDEYSPISRNSKFLVDKKDGSGPVNGGAGWIIVDGLDTAIMMNCTEQVAQARKWIKTSLDFGKLDGEINTFETTIRVLGGLLSAQYISTTFPQLAPQRDDDRGQKGEDLYIEKAVDLAERLLSAFDTPSGIPYASINLNTTQGIPSHDADGVSSTAEATTMQLELKYLAKLTGEPLYWTVAEKVMQVVDTPRMEGGLLPIFINPETGKFEGEIFRLGSRGDSYYEYLIKQYLQTGEKIYKQMWDEALEGIKRHMITWSSAADFTVLAERPYGLKGQWSGKMDHLTCFLPGTIALGVTGGLSVVEAKKKMGSDWGHKQEEDLVLAEELMKTCWGMYVFTPTGLAAEITYLDIDDPPRRWNFDNGWKQPRSKADFDNLYSDDYRKKDALWRSDFEVEPNDVHNLQRPEMVESLYYMWRITGKSVYRDWGWRVFISWKEYAKVVDRNGKISGYTSLENVMSTKPKHLDTVVAGTNIAQHMAGGKKASFARDNLEGFWLSESLKYLFLLFCDDVYHEWFDLTKVVLNTEAHIFPRFDISDGKFKTGWVRRSKQTGS